MLFFLNGASFFYLYFLSVSFILLQFFIYLKKKYDVRRFMPTTTTTKTPSLLKLALSNRNYIFFVRKHKTKKWVPHIVWVRVRMCELLYWNMILIDTQFFILVFNRNDTLKKIGLSMDNYDLNIWLKLIFIICVCLWLIWQFFISSSKKVFSYKSYK